MRSSAARDASAAERALSFPEEWETDSDEERRSVAAREAEDAKDPERSALKTMGRLFRGAKANINSDDVSRRAGAKWAASAASADASSALVAAFARSRARVASAASFPENVEASSLIFFDENKPLRRRAPIGPPPLGAERLARLTACLEAHPPFRGVEMRVLREAARDLERKVLRPGEALFAQGSNTRDYAYVVEAGELEGRAVEEQPRPESSSESSSDSAPAEAAEAAEARRRRAENVAAFRSGDVFGDVELTFGVPRERSVVAAARGAKVWGMRRRWFERLNAPCVARRRDAFRNVVRTSPLLASLPFAEQRAAAELLAELGDAFRADAGETVVAQDGEPGRVFLITSGTADARVAVPELERPLLVGTFARGDAFGHLEFFLEEERDHSGDVSGLDDADLRETCAVANRASVVASTRLRGVAVDGVAFRAIAPPGTALRRALDAERATFANGVA